MICPKCENDFLLRSRMKNDQRVAYVCEYCGSFWFEEEKIYSTTGHRLVSYLRGGEREYTIEPLTEKDQEHTSAAFTNHK